MVPARRQLRLLLIILILICSPALVRAQIDEQKFQQDLQAIATHSRAVGSDGYYKAANYLENQINSLPGVEWRRQEFPVVVPVTNLATLTLPGGRVENVYPFWPAKV